MKNNTPSNISINGFLMSFDLKKKSIQIHKNMHNEYAKIVSENICVVFIIQNLESLTTTACMD